MEDPLDYILNQIKEIKDRLENHVTHESPYGWTGIVPSLVEAGGALAGGALNVGTYSVGPLGSGATYTFNYPATAVALYVFMGAKWAAPSDTTYAYAIPNGGAVTDLDIICGALVANLTTRKTGIVNLDSSGLFQIVVVNANATVFSFRIMGYFI